VHGTNRLVQPRPDTILAAAERAVARRSPARPMIERWDGRAAQRIVSVLCDDERLDDVAVEEERLLRHAVASPLLERAQGQQRVQHEEVGV